MRKTPKIKKEKEKKNSKISAPIQTDSNELDEHSTQTLSTG